jgi:hypothetical protein
MKDTEPILYDASHITMDIDGTLHIKGNLSTLYFSGPVKHI